MNHELFVSLTECLFFCELGRENCERENRRTSCMDMSMIRI